MASVLSHASRVVLKLGTQTVVTGEGRFASKTVGPFLRSLANLHKKGTEALIVSSGAVGLGRAHLNLPRRALDLQEKQACAAIGQSLLMVEYARFFARHKIRVAQVLLTAADFSERARFLNLRNTLEKLLSLRVIPIINENDVVSTQELTPLSQDKSFGDNDRLSALVAGKLDSDLLLLLTDVDGVYTANPKKDRNAQRIQTVESLEELKRISTQGRSELGRGGMRSKLEAARIASISGCHVFVGSVFPDLKKPLDASGTWIKSQNKGQGKRLDQRKKWIGTFSGFSGILTLNDGALQALREKKASLLPGGITEVQGSFKPGQIVSIQDVHGNEWGRGVTRYSSDEIARIKGHHSSEIAGLIGHQHGAEVIHRDHLVLFDGNPEGALHGDS